MKQKLNNDMILLLILYADNQSKIIGRTRLQKLVFLYEKEFPYKLHQDRPSGLFNYFAYDYGPFSKDLYKHIKNLKALDMTLVENEKELDQYADTIDRETEYSITQDGIECVVEELIQKGRIDEFEMEAMDKFKRDYNDMELNKLVKFVYEKYPEYTKNSKIKDKVFGAVIEWIRAG